MLPAVDFKSASAANCNGPVLESIVIASALVHAAPCPTVVPPVVESRSMVVPALNIDPVPIVVVALDIDMLLPELRLPSLPKSTVPELPTVNDMDVPDVHVKSSSTVKEPAERSQSSLPPKAANVLTVPIVQLPLVEVTLASVNTLTFQLLPTLIEALPVATARFAPTSSKPESLSSTAPEVAEMDRLLPVFSANESS